MIIGNRVRQARELRGLTQTELARRIGLAQPSIAQIEAGLFEPSDAVIKAIALQTGFPPSFFRRPPDPEFPMGSLLFRAHADTPARTKVQAHQLARVIYGIVHELAHRVRPLPVSLPRIAEDPVAAAGLTRSALSLSPDSPIGNLVRSLEKIGVLVVALPLSTEGLDAFSAWVGDDARQPVIAARVGVPGDRLRMTVAHEVGHLVLHHTLRVAGKQLEIEAFRFASELLMPDVAMRAELIPPITLTGLSLLKPRWGVSIQALARRAKDLEIISSRQYTYLFEQLSAKGWKKAEPVPIASEKPRTLRKMAELIYGVPIDYQRLASDLQLPARLAQMVLEAHAGNGNGVEKGSSARSHKVVQLRSRGRDE